MTRKWPALAIVALALLSPVVAHMLAGDTAQALETERPTRRVVQTSILASGSFVFEGQVELSPQIIGRVTKVYVREGDTVRVGQPMVQIEASTYRASRDQQSAGYDIQRARMVEQRAALSNERAKFNRVALLAERGFVARQQLDDAHQAVVSAEANLHASESSIAQSRAILDQAEEELRKTTITSPIEGFVTSLNIKQGETAVPSTIGIQGAPLITIAKRGSMILELSVGESDIATIRPGQRVTIHPVSYPERTLQGEVGFVSIARRREAGLSAAQGDAARTYTVKVRFTPPTDIDLKPAMTCRAEVLVTSPTPVLSVPLQAVFNNNGIDGEDDGAETVTNHVFVVRNGSAAKRLVTLGASDDTFVEVRSGLDNSDVVLTGPYRKVKFLREGERVTAIMHEAAVR